ncbi:MAG TPA: hypothetical protein PLH87_08420, partial [Bacillota bacterium]|nr:hypothetical protein [Bacillota bacterium]
MKRIIPISLMALLIIALTVAGCGGGGGKGGKKGSIDVYVAGYEYNGSGCVAKYWKNSHGVPLSGETDYTCATSIYVSGNDV